MEIKCEINRIFNHAKMIEDDIELIKNKLKYVEDDYGLRETLDNLIKSFNDINKCNPGERNNKIEV